MESLGKSIRAAMDSVRPAAPVRKHFVPSAKDIMTTELRVCTPGQHAREVIALLLKHQISGAPVVDKDYRLVGVISEMDCLRVLAAGTFHEGGYAEHLTVGDLMSASVETVAPDADIYSVAGRFRSLGLRRLPVVDGERLLGQVSRRDVLRGIQQMNDRVRSA